MKRLAWIPLVLLPSCGGPAASAPASAPPPDRARVHGTFLCEPLGRAPVDVWLTVYRLPEGRGLRRTSWSDGGFSMDLKPGKYRFQMGGVEVYPMSMDVEVPPGVVEVDLGEIALGPSMLSYHYGKPPPPLSVTEARGFDAKTSLADLKGRWVVLLFWGYW